MLRTLWTYRRWGYAFWLLASVSRIPARTGFRLHGLACDTHLTLHNAALSMTKVPHMVLFGLFFVVTIVMFDRVTWRALGWSLMATGAMGLLVELLEGATRTGNCRLTDVLPDLAGALVAMALTVAFVRARVDHPPSDGVGGDERSTLLL
jgi:VanZ family protein